MTGSSSVAATDALRNRYGQPGTVLLIWLVTGRVRQLFSRPAPRTTAQR